MKLFFYLFLALFIYSCANDYTRSPRGGEEDKTPLEIVGASLKNGSLNVDRDIDVYIDFNEYFYWESRTNGLEISPYSIKDNYSVEWNESGLSIDFFDLPEDQTVFISLNTNLKDLRKNSLKDNYILAFSTGNRLDSCEVKATLKYEVVGDKFNKIKNFSDYKIALYDYNEVLDSTIYNSRIRYYLGVNKEGKAHFKNIKEGEYLPLLLKDRNRNNRAEFYNDELYSTGNGKINLGGNGKDSLVFTAAIFDTIPANIESVKPLNSSLIMLNFSEEIKRFNIEKIVIDTTETEFELLKNSQNKELIIFVKDSLKDYNNIEIDFGSIIDIWGNKTEKKLLKYKFMTDSVPMANFGIKSTSNFTTNEDDTLVVRYTTKSEIKPSFFLATDKLINLDSKLIRSPLEDRLPLSDLDDPDGEDLLVKLREDTLLLKKFKLSRSKGRGSVLFDTVPSTKRPVLLAKEVDTGKRKAIKDVKFPLTLTLEAGRYTFSLFDDINGNGLYDGGMKSNFISESFYFVKDTIEVRKNWETNGIFFTK
ncbi:MAG: hypothetical protein CR982_03080 [Candidatus Cloacimonadota bacterium]|nr:MAG: hypothetical protein CR982_03080 [Candidatus Cloacimonadota bacterium]PIE82047.1 MAG: hypothetical protein CSA15_00270 [Candidatus Delongbacteria bacterium]